MGCDKKQELLGIKLKNAILAGKNPNKTTPSPTWKLGFHSSSIDPNFPMNNSVSARKIGANLWELEPQFNFNTDGDAGGGARRSHRRRRGHSHDKEGFELSDQLDEDPPDGHPQPPETETSLRRNHRGLPSLCHLSVGKDGENLQHVSSASCCSSMEVTPYVYAATPTRYTVKTSTHLLKVLNRIWNLEEQHSSNMALIKALKRELDNSRAQVKTLVEETKRGRQEMDELKKSTHEQMKKAVRSTREELLYVRSSLMREKKARILLESLCDEFAKGIRDYEQKVRSLLQNRRKRDQLMGKNELDRLILHVSEAWLDERMQMKCDLLEKTSISDNLCFEIETFLQAKQKKSHGPRVEDGKIPEKHEENKLCGAAEPSSQSMSRMAARDAGAGEPCLQSMSRMAVHGPGDAEPSSQLMSRMAVHGPGDAEPSSQLMSRMAGVPGASESSVESMSRMAGQVPGGAEPFAESISRMPDQGPGEAEPSSQTISRMTALGSIAAEPSLKSMSRTTDQGPGAAERSSQLMSGMTDLGPRATEPSSESMSRLAACGLGVTEPSSRLMSRATNGGLGVAEPASQSMSRTTDRDPGVDEPSARGAREGVKQNTLMARLLEARLESQLSKSRTVRR